MLRVVVFIAWSIGLLFVGRAGSTVLLEVPAVLFNRRAICGLQ